MTEYAASAATKLNGLTQRAQRSQSFQFTPWRTLRPLREALPVNPAF